MATKIVLIKLADNANDEGFCWPSLDYVSEQCECDKTTVKRHIKRLEELNLVHIQHRTQDNTNLSNYYHLNLPLEPGGGRGAQPPGVGAHSPPNLHINLRRLGGRTAPRGRIEPLVGAHSPHPSEKPNTQVEKKRIQLILHNLGEKFKPREDPKRR